MLGGGIGTFYITGFAASRMLGLVPYAAAFALMASATLLAFVLYACLILVGNAAIYVFKGRRSLLLASFVGVWTIFLTGCEGVLLSPVVSAAERWTLQLGVVFAWLVLRLAPAGREVLRHRNPARWPLPEPGGLLRSIPKPVSQRAANEARRTGGDAAELSTTCCA